MDTLRPESPAQLAEAMAAAASAHRTITLGGAFTKDGMAGPIAPSDVRISTAGLTRVLQYDPRDLTISVEAGIPYRELSAVLAENRQMLPLDPPFSGRATVGGVLAANTNGPRRRLFGTARDFVIGMKFVTLEGKLIESGGMVVKNVAGLDMAKMMIGSFGTLAAIAVANFKLAPAPPESRTFLLAFASAAEAAASRDGILRGVLQPTALDLLSPAASARLSLDGFVLAVQACGSFAVMDRYARELSGAQILEDAAESEFWRQVQDFTPEFLAAGSGAVVARLSSTLSELQAILESTEVPIVTRAGNGVCHLYFSNAAEGQTWFKSIRGRDWRAVVEFASQTDRETMDLWPEPGSDLETMKRVKTMFDPENLLNRGRLYGRI